jgi:hypothetical protein
LIEIFLLLTARFLWQKFPLFVLRFLLISLLVSISVFTKPQLTVLGNRRDGRFC